MCINGKAVKDPKLISNAYNEYFVNVGNTLSKNIKKPAASDCTFTETSLIVNQSNSFFLRQIATLEVRNCINEMKSSKSVGKSGISVKYIKLALDVISRILANIYNCCIASDCFPDILKIAEVIPIYKAGAKNICSNYRPISVISLFSKILEKCLYTQLCNYFTRNQLLNKNQYGFIKHSSTSDAVIDAYNEILLNLDQKKQLSHYS